jgi:hypothetical protein
MAAPKLRGPHKLMSGVIDIFVPPGVAGIYALGAIAPGGLQHVDAVGRAEQSLGDTLKSLIGVNSGFMFATVSSATEAFLMECELYHVHMLTGRRAHPIAPEKSALDCPICGAS